MNIPRVPTYAAACFGLQHILVLLDLHQGLSVNSMRCSMHWLSVQEGLPRAHGHHAAGALLMVCCDSSTMRVEDDVAFFLKTSVGIPSTDV